jgi:hypothetical protein
MASVVSSLRGSAGLVATAVDPIPAAPPIGGLAWSVVVPALLFAVSVGATVLLYRFFAKRGGG